mmetsp:Transcript_20061/g.17153  ORF Transcript_20061/g.17153 Transcript_20061/m.17153 type:complete len:172 (+) Transcript_20061:1363-1878(+)
MFGDIGHGALLAIFGAYLCLANDSIAKDKTSLMNSLLPARYLLLLQGIFACYCGFIYNDMSSVPLNLFGTCYPGKNPERSSLDCVYPFGVDPVWYGMENELAFMNSLKMKLAIILGVIHMTFGILLKGVNAIHFKSCIDFVFEFIPMITFMSLTFGYMVVLVFLKWSLPWN